MKWHFLAVCAAMALLPRAAAAQEGDAVPINMIQVVGTHNSYAMPADPRVMQLMGPRLSALRKAMSDTLSEEQRAQLEDEHPGGLTDVASSLDYVQLPLQAQLRSGVRSIELDLQPDPKGGAFIDPLSYRLLREQGVTDLAPLYREELAKPGLKVFHIADLDVRSQCPTFRSCLTLLKQWSDSEPNHSPVFVLLEPKLAGLDRAIPGATALPPFDKAAFEEVDESIRSILGSGKLFAPTTCAAECRRWRPPRLPSAGPRCAMCAGSSSSSSSSRG